MTQYFLREKRKKVWEIKRVAENEKEQSRNIKQQAKLVKKAKTVCCYYRKSVLLKINIKRNRRKRTLKR